MPIKNDVRLGKDVRIFHPDLVNLYGCTVGGRSPVGTFVEIQAAAMAGARCKISSHTFICEGVTIEDAVFIGHGVIHLAMRHLSPASNRTGILNRTLQGLELPSLQLIRPIRSGALTETIPCVTAHVITTLSKKYWFAIPSQSYG
jgi:hypothetical protein